MYYYKQTDENGNLILLFSCDKKRTSNTDRAVNEIDEEEYNSIFCKLSDICEFTDSVYAGETTIDNIPYELRETVKESVADRITKFGEYKHQTVTATELQKMIEEVL